MNKESCFELGRVVKGHGTNGMARVMLDVDVPEEYKELESVFVEVNGDLVPFFIEEIVIKDGGKSLIKFEDIDDLASAESLRGAVLYLPLELLPVLDDGKFYYHEIVGYKAYDNNESLGTVIAVYASGKQDLIAISVGGKEVLAPVQDEIVLSVDKNAKIIYLKLPDGLLDVYLKD